MRKTGSLKSAIRDALMNSIVRGEYKPGEILNEGRLVEKFGCSRAPVREALAALCNDGLLRSIPRCGYEIVRITMDDISDMLQFRILLEGGMMDAVCRNLDASKLQHLRELAARCERDTDSMWNHWDYNVQFHLTLLSYSRNEYARQILQHTMNLLKCAYGQHYWDKWDVICPSDMKYHKKILDALEKGDASQAAKYLEMDLKDFIAFS